MTRPYGGQRTKERQRPVTADDILPLFSRPDGTYHFARWRRPVVPVVFGVEDATLAIVKGALEAVVATAGHRMAETDSEQGANLFIFFIRDWTEIDGVPELDGLVPGMGEQARRLAQVGADRYFHFRFESDGAIRACVAFLRMAGPLQDEPAEDLALGLALRVMLLWADGAFRTAPPLVRTGAGAALRPDIAALLRAAYDPAMPATAGDASHALRLSARMNLAG